MVSRSLSITGEHLRKFILRRLLKTNPADLLRIESWPSRKLLWEGERVGSIFLEGDTVEYPQLLEGYLLFFALIVLAVSLGAYVMAERLQRPISDPILQLAWTAKLVTGSRDYSIRRWKTIGGRSWRPNRRLQ